MMDRIMKRFSLLVSGVIILQLTVCVPPSESSTEVDETAESLREQVSERRCLQLLSSAAEYYKNKDWKSTVRVYRELVVLGCDKDNEEEVFQYWAIAYEYLGLFDSSEYVLLQGLKRLPQNIDLHNRLTYAYKRLGNTEKEISEYERIIDLVPEDTEPMKRLNELYGEVGRYEDQIYIIRKILNLEPDNIDAQGDLARAFEQTGKDPLDIYRQRFRDNPENLSFGLDLADQLSAVGEYQEAVTVLNSLKSSGGGNSSVSAKLVLKKLAQAYYRVDRLKETSTTYEELFNLDRRDFRTALEIVKVEIELADFSNALRWADIAIRIVPENGETYGHKGLVFYRSFQDCRQNYPTISDRIVASLAYKYFNRSEELTFKRFMRDRLYLEENKDDLMFGRANWFMLDDEQKRKGSIAPTSECYSWIKESINKDPSWR